MRLTHCMRGALLVAVLPLPACAPSVTLSDLSQPNFGYRVLPHFDASVDPDPVAVANGLYAPVISQDPCLRGFFRCSTQDQFNWSGWAP